MDAGRIGFVAKGDYDSSINYEQLDVVYHNGSTWMAVQDSQGQEPSEDSEYWQLAVAAATDHIQQSIVSEDGVHDIRYNQTEEVLQIYNKNTREWSDIPTENTPIYLAEPTNILVTAGDEEVVIKWTDPDDVVVDGVTLATWKGTVVVRNIGSPPTSKNDGELIYDSRIKNSFESFGLVDETVHNGITYYYGIFPYTNDMNYRTTAVREAEPYEIPPTAPSSSEIRTEASSKSITVSFDTPIGITSQIIVCKEGTEAPTSPYDGLTLTTNPCVFTNLSKGTQYQIKVYVYNEKGRVAESQVKSISTTNYTYMTIKIDQNNPNPETCCTYHDDAIGMEPGSDAWDEFFGWYPCVLKNGVEVGKLKKNNIFYYENENKANKDDGDFMYCFPIRYIKADCVDNIITITLTDDRSYGINNSYAFYTYQGFYGSKFYYGILCGETYTDKLTSNPWNSGYKSDTIANHRTYAKNNYSLYGVLSFYRYSYLQFLYLLKYKNLDSYNVLTNREGYYGPWRCLMLNDEFIDGALVTSYGQFKTGLRNFNDAGNGYSDVLPFSKNIAGYISKIKANTYNCLIPSECNGSSTTYFCDKFDSFYEINNRPSVLIHYGVNMGGGESGLFAMDFYRSFNEQCGARLEYVV